MQKHIMPLIAAIVVFGLASCQPDVVESRKTKEPTIEVPVEEKSEETEEEPTIDPDINDWKPGTGGSIDLGEK